MNRRVGIISALFALIALYAVFAYAEDPASISATASPPASNEMYQPRMFSAVRAPAGTTVPHFVCNDNGPMHLWCEARNAEGLDVVWNVRMTDQFGRKIFLEDPAYGPIKMELLVGYKCVEVFMTYALPGQKPHGGWKATGRKRIDGTFVEEHCPRSPATRKSEQVAGGAQ